MAFFEVEFPTKLSFGAIGGPSFKTTVTEGFSGYENRNRDWAQTRGKWDVTLLRKTQADYDLIQAFFLAVGGSADGFRFKDHKDFKAQAQPIGTGDGAKKTFQLVKLYTNNGRTYTRTIKKPITSAVKNYQGQALADTVVIYIGGVAQGAATYAVDATAGIVTFNVAPALNAVITADFQFHFPVRFVSDELRATVEESDAAGGNAQITWNAIQLIEVRV